MYVHHKKPHYWKEENEIHWHNELVDFNFFQDCLHNAVKYCLKMLYIEKMLKFNK